MPTIATVLGIALFVVAGNWQHGRMEQKLALRTQLDAAAAAPPVDLPVDAKWVEWRFRPVVLEGRFDAGRQILIDNKVEGGRVGYHVVTPLLLSDSRAVLVDRGFVAAGATRDALPDVPPPLGPVTIHGRINIPPAGYVELQHADATGAVWQNLDPTRFGQVSGLPVVPIVIEQTAALGATDRLLRQWPVPDVGVDKHRIYMVQWYAFALMTGGLWLWFTWRRRQ
ncbi:MAG: SURF1 family protein [Betaproteobacteria bacterium]